jgi:sulfur relay protein TusB/DsrH
MSKLISAEGSTSIFKLAGKLAEKREDVALLHIQEACRAAVSADYCSRPLETGVKVYALKADVEARKLTEKMHPSVELIDYKQWVSLLMDKHDKVVSWTG